MSYASERAAAIDAVVHASQLCRAVQQRLVAGTTLQKGDKSPVTVADFGAQAIVAARLARAFPDLPMVGEEDAAALRESGNEALRDKVVAGVHSVMPELTPEAILLAIDRGTYAGGDTGQHWCLDPIDGTKGFLRLDQYAVALALIVDGEPVLGVLGCPNLPHDASNPDGGRGCIFVGVQGQGAFWRTLDDPTEHPISVSEVTNPAQAVFCESVEKAHSNQSHSALIAQRLGITAEPFRIDSQCKYAAVARADASVYLRLPTRKDYVERIWDHAAGFRVVVEAGGTVTDVYGTPLNFGLGRGLENNKGVIVTNGPMHEQVLAAVRVVLEL